MVGISAPLPTPISPSPLATESCQAMFNDSVSFNGSTRVEVISVLANCGRDTDKARRALVTWIRCKQDKGRTTEHILAKLRDIESKFIKDPSLHTAFRDARAETFLPRAPDIPLPPSVRRKSEGQAPGSVGSPYSAGYSSVSSPSSHLPMYSTQQTSPPVSPLRLSRDSSQMHISEVHRGTLATSRPISLPQASHIAPLRSPRIQIPRDRSSQPCPSSPITSSPEDSGLHLRYRYMSHPVKPSRSPSQVSALSSSPPQLLSASTSSRSRYSDRGLFRGPVSQIPPPIQIPRSRSQPSLPDLPRTSSSEESDCPYYEYMASPRTPMSPGRRRVTPPTTNPPGVPLPPIPADERDTDSSSGISKRSIPAEHPPTPARPLPVQPLPTPVPDSDESEHTDTISGSSLRRRWQESNGDLPSDDIVREDSPVCVFHDDHASPIGIGPPPPYVDQLDTYSPPDMPPIGDSLDRAVDVCGGSLEVRLEVSKCIGFHRGYEPPYWQTRLQACGLNAQAAKYLVDEMSKQVDWTPPFGRAL